MLSTSLSVDFSMSSMFSCHVVVVAITRRTYINNVGVNSGKKKFNLLPYPERSYARVTLDSRGNLSSSSDIDSGFAPKTQFTGKVLIASL